MQINVKSRNAKLTDEERLYLETKLKKLARYSDGIGMIVVEVARQDQRGAGLLNVVQATLHAEHGMIIRAEEREAAFGATVDALHDRLQRQLTRWKDRNYRRGQGRRPDEQAVQRSGQSNPGGETGNSGRESEPQLVRTKQFRYKPMSTDEAIEQMELLDHDFFIFTDARTNQANVVYRRNDGNYGLIEPSTEAEP